MLQMKKIPITGSTILLKFKRTAFRWIYSRTGALSCSLIFIPRFHRMYPDITVIPRELSVQKQQSLLLSGSLDLGFVTLTPSQQKASLTYINLSEERILAGVPLRHPVATPLDSSDGTPVADMTDMASELQELDLYRLREEPFVLTYQESTLREMTDQIFKKPDLLPMYFLRPLITPQLPL